ncbi:MAG TPA: SDR family oxidoreductase [Bacteroidota bacterium]|nr:SDR family oxidoreductase [Bacteroidota bacterium]
MAEHFFMTGGTGLVGTHLIPRLLRAFPGSVITLLVRGESDADVTARMEGISREAERMSGIPGARERVRGLRGDVLQEGCGLPAGELEAIVRETTYIVHGAATIRFDHPLEEAREVNCGGTRRVLAIAGRCADRGRLKRFVYIGTSSVSGRRGGVVTEDELEMGQQFFNTYEQSKCESERIVRDIFPRIPAVIFRPSIIIGDSRTGATSSFNVIYIPLRLVERGMLSFVPGTPSTKMDLVPIDWVDDVMVHIMGLDAANGKVCHVTAGPDRAAPLGEVVLSATAYFDLHAPLAAPRTMEFVSREEFERRRRLTRGREEALLGQLDTLLPYVSIDRLFDSTNTDALLEGSGITFPPFHTYEEKIFAYCLRTRWGKIPG